MGERVVPSLRKIVQRVSEFKIHATWGLLFCPALYRRTGEVRFLSVKLIAKLWHVWWTHPNPLVFLLFFLPIWRIEPRIRYAHILSEAILDLILPEIIEIHIEDTIQSISCSKFCLQLLAFMSNTCAFLKSGSRCSCSSKHFNWQIDRLTKPSVMLESHKPGHWQGSCVAAPIRHTVRQWHMLSQPGYGIMVCHRQVSARAAPCQPGLGLTTWAGQPEPQVRWTFQ